MRRHFSPSLSASSKARARGGVVVAIGGLGSSLAAPDLPMDLPMDLWPRQAPPAWPATRTNSARRQRTRTTKRCAPPPSPSPPTAMQSWQHPLFAPLKSIGTVQKSGPGGEQADGAGTRARQGDTAILPKTDTFAWWYCRRATHRAAVTGTSVAPRAVGSIRLPAASRSSERGDHARGAEAIA